MKRVLKISGYLLRLGIGVGIVACLLAWINTHTRCVDFTLEMNSSAAGGALYADCADSHRRFAVIEDMDNGPVLRTVQRKGATHLAASGSLKIVAGNGDPVLRWTAWKSSRSGLQYLWDVIRSTLSRWQWIAAALLLYYAAIALITIRWKCILDTQGVPISWKRVFSIAFVGAFFNSFMPGSVGGDLVRGYYTAREATHRRTELFLSVFIDRMLGLPSILLMPLAALLMKPSLALSNPATKSAFLVILLMIVASVVLFLLLFRLDLFEKHGFLKRIEEKTSLGAVLRRAYAAFRLCLTHPALVLKTFLLSVAGQSVGVAASFFLVYALGERVPFAEFFPLCLVVMFVSGIPVTPGGLGLREAAMVMLMSAAGIPAVTALALSLLVYICTLICGATGAIAFICFSGPRDRAQAEAAPDPSRP